MAKRKTDREVLSEHIKSNNGVFFKPAIDDWSPCYDGNLVKVRLGYANFEGQDHFNIVVRGQDDCARVLYCTGSEHQTQIANRLYGCSLISKAMLSELGFSDT
ncbi:hypothetical protein VCHA53O466_50180 [Vibrio chagasii]|nr:hypothetical protein VCHA53O466_50180 [Vibrio chagasii]